MLDRFRALYLRYASHNAARLCGIGFPRHGLRRPGQIEGVVRTADSLDLSGWAALPAFRLSWPGGSREVVPDRPRADVAMRTGGKGNAGFAVTLPVEAKPLLLEITTPSGRTLRCEVPDPADPPGPAARRRMMRAFLRNLVLAAPALLGYALRPDAVRRVAAKRALGIDGEVSIPLLDRDWLEGIPPVPAKPGTFTIVIPVHDAYDVLTQALDRIAQYTSGDWHAILIDDASTDPRVRPFLEAWTEAHGSRSTLLALDRNVGFVGAVNRGLAMAEARGGPVVLLNTDALVPERWAERLLAPLGDRRIASVTPMSNDAEIFGAPLPGIPVPLSPGMADRIDRIAQGLSSGVALPEAPTGVGFCMALSRHWLTKVPRFDEAFGRGYGEEVDWCQKVRKLGGRHLGLPSLFVEHRGGASFGAAKAVRVRQANALIARRYPGYDGQVHTFFARDPLRTPRLALAIAAAGFGARGSLPLFLAHSMGGGAEAALSEEINAELVRTGAALVLRVGGHRRFRLELHLPEGRLAGDADDADVLRRLLAPVPRLRIIYSCGVGDPDPVALPALLLSFCRSGGDDRLEARLHDFFPLSPSYCLLDSHGRYRGPPLVDCADPAHVTRRPDGSLVSLPDWRAAWSRLLVRCEEVTAFSEASAVIFSTAYPALGASVAVRPHVVRWMPQPVTAPRPEPGTIGVLGNLNAQKGAAVVALLAERLRKSGDPRRVVVIGNVDPARPLPRCVRVHGAYGRHEIADLARRYRVAEWIVPSVWPETYSFATREALATGLPVHAFDIGGQGEAVLTAHNGRPVAFDPDADPAASMHAALTRPPVPASGQLPKKPTLAGALPQ